MIQEASRETEKERSEASRGKRSQGVEGRKILNKRKVREEIKYLVQWKRFMAEHNSWEKKEDLENAKKVVAKFKKRINVEVGR